MSTEHPTEEFRPVPGFPNHRVSNLGRVQRKKTPGRKWPDPENYIWRDCRLGFAGEGYVVARFSVGKAKTVTRYVHRLVLEAFVGPCPDGMQARHVLSRDKTDNRLVNLCWGTPLENMEDCHRHGTYLVGERKGTNKLTAVDVVEMRRLRALGWTFAMLSQKFGVRKETAHKVCCRRTWAHI